MNEELRVCPSFPFQRQADSMDGRAEMLKVNSNYSITHFVRLDARRSFRFVIYGKHNGEP